MLAKKYRITRSPHLASRTQKFHARNMYAQCSVFLRMGNEGAEPSRFSIAVGKSVSKSAVSRNAMRRIVSSIIERHLSVFLPSFDIHIRVVRNIRELSYQELDRIFGKLFRDAKVIL